MTQLVVVRFVQAYPLLFLCIASTPMLLTLLSWLGSREKDATTSTRTLSQQHRAHLLRRLRSQYEQLLAHSLQGIVQIELGWASRPAAVQNVASLSLRFPDQQEHLLASHTSIVEIYDQAQQELLILGEPGAGKSTLLLDLAYHLVERAEQDATQPLPVLLPLSSWTTNRRSLQDWIVEQLALLYTLSRRNSRQWAQTEQLLLLLDGLDEMEASTRAACITAINTYHREHVQPLVACSRTSEYETASRYERLALHAAVVVQPLSAAQVDSYLENQGEPLAALRTVLKENGALAELATTPLLLHVLILAYHSISIQALSHKEAQLRRQIWDDYVQRMVSRKGDTKRYPLSITLVWLGWLAQEMRNHNQTIFFPQLLQPDWLPKKFLLLYHWSVGLPMGVFSGLLGGLGVGLSSGLFSGLLPGLFSGLLFGLLGWLIAGLLFRRPEKLELSEGGALLRHSTLRFWLWRAHLFPWKMVPFLEDATARVLLRRVGGGYSFAHHLLREHFADLHSEPPPSDVQSAQIPSE